MPKRDGKFVVGYTRAADNRIPVGRPFVDGEMGFTEDGMTVAVWVCPRAHYEKLTHIQVAEAICELLNSSPRFKE